MSTSEKVFHSLNID